MHSPTKNLILLNQPGAQDRRDFEEIAVRIAEAAPDIHVQIVQMTNGQDGLPETFWRRPAFSVSMLPPRYFRPKRGPLYHGLPIPKLVQMKKFVEAGIPVPAAKRYQLGTGLDPSFWGDHVILKTAVPLATSLGDAVFLVPVRRVRELAPVLFPPGHRGRAALLVQRFVDTGDYPESYRVLTLFGEPLHSVTYRSKASRPPLDATGGEACSVASNIEPDFTCELTTGEDVLAFARRAAAAMPRVPLQGLDIIRDRHSGKLYVLEANPGGNTWHFSSKLAEEGRKEVSREARIAQLDAWGVAARVLAERTRAEAA